MKNSLKYISALLLIVVFAASCSKKLDEAGISPNNTSSVPPSVLLTASEVYVGYSVGGDMARYTGIFDQHIAGADRQFAVYNRYIFSPSEFDNVWQNIYLGLYNLKDLSDSAVVRKQYAYAGIANILSAYTLGMSSDVWGDLPYSTAFKGQDNITNPATFDKQADVYNTVQNLLDSGIARLALDPGPITPSADDLVYGGDVVKWTKLAYALKARFYLHQRKLDAGAMTKATAALANGFTSSSEDAYLYFGNSSKSANPWYQFFQQRPGYITLLGGTATTQLIATSDPRLAAYVDTAADQLGTFYGNTNSGIQLMTYAEQKFIEAEIAFIGSDKPTAATALNDATKESVSAISGSPAPAGWEATYASETAATITLEKIMNQKYLALFLNPESFTDWRRTGFPVLTPNAGTSIDIPRRFLYPQTEQERNKNTPIGVQLTDKVGWDL
jgi:hypothetical protein